LSFYLLFVTVVVVVVVVTIWPCASLKTYGHTMIFMSVCVQRGSVG